MKIQRNKHILYKYVKGVLYVFDSKTMKLHTYNAVASLVWHVAIKPIPFEKVLEKVMDKFAVDRNTLRKDLHSFVKNEAHDNGIITIVP